VVSGRGKRRNFILICNRQFVICNLQESDQVSVVSERPGDTSGYRPRGL